MTKLKIINIVLNGKLPFKHKLKEDEVKKLINKGEMGWQVINEENFPILQAHIEKEGMTVRRRKRNACVSIWTTGAINIVGVQEVKEGNKFYDLILKEIKKLCPRVLK